MAGTAKERAAVERNFRSSSPHETGDYFGNSTKIYLKMLQIWPFCNDIMSPEEFKRRMNVLKELYDSSRRFIDPDLESILLTGFENPEKSAQLVIDPV